MTTESALLAFNDAPYAQFGGNLETQLQEIVKMDQFEKQLGKDTTGLSNIDMGVIFLHSDHCKSHQERKNLLEVIEKRIETTDDLEDHQWGENNTTLHLAAFFNNISLCERLIEKSPNLARVSNSAGYLPAYVTSNTELQHKLLLISSKLDEKRIPVSENPFLLADRAFRATKVRDSLKLAAPKQRKTVLDYWNVKHQPSAPISKLNEEKSQSSEETLLELPSTSSIIENTNRHSKQDTIPSITESKAPEIKLDILVDDSYDSWIENYYNYADYTPEKPTIHAPIPESIDSSIHTQQKVLESLTIQPKQESSPKKKRVNFPPAWAGHLIKKNYIDQESPVSCKSRIHSNGLLLLRIDSIHYNTYAESGEFSLQLNVAHKQSSHPLSGIRFLPNEEWSSQQIKSEVFIHVGPNEAITLEASLNLMNHKRFGSLSKMKPKKLIENSKKIFGSIGRTSQKEEGIPQWPSESFSLHLSEMTQDCVGNVVKVGHKVQFRSEGMQSKQVQIHLSLSMTYIPGDIVRNTSLNIPNSLTECESLFARRDWLSIEHTMEGDLYVEKSGETRERLHFTMDGIFLVGCRDEKMIRIDLSMIQSIHGGGLNVDMSQLDGPLILDLRTMEFKKELGPYFTNDICLTFKDGEQLYLMTETLEECGQWAKWLAIICTDEWSLDHSEWMNALNKC